VKRAKKRLRLRVEAVAHAGLGQQVLGIGRISLDLAAQAADIDPQIFGLVAVPGVLLSSSR